MILEGQIAAVVEERAGTELFAAASAGAQTIVVADLLGLDEDGGTLAIGEAEEVTPEVIAYAVPSPDELPTGGYEVALLTPLAGAHAAETPVLVEPATLERTAYVLAGEQAEEIEARIPHALYDRIPAGTRNVDDADEAEVAVVALDDEEWVVTDLLDQAPRVDGEFIDPDTLPEPTPIPPTDGLPPASSPTATVRGGIGSLVVTWPAIANADPVTYEVHLSTVAGFTPDATTLAAEVAGTTVFLRTLPSGLALDYATVYRVKLIAKDEDGSAAPSAVAGVGSPAQVNSPDIFAEAVTADKILANTALFDKLEALMFIANTIKVPGDTGQRIELDQSGIRMFDADELEKFAADAASGNVHVAGTVDFGEESHLLSDDMVDLGLFGGAGLWQTPTLAASSSERSEFGASPSQAAPGGTMAAGNLAVVVLKWDSNRTVTPPVNWTKRAERVSGNHRLALFTRDVETPMANTGIFTLSGTANWRMRTFVWSGVQVAAGASSFDVAGTNFGTGGAPSVSATTTHARDLVIAVAATVANTTFAGTVAGFSPLGAKSDQISPHHKTVTATGLQTAGFVINPSMDWMALIVALKTKPSGNPPAGGADSLRLFSKKIGAGKPSLFLMDEVGGAAGLRSLVESAQNARQMLNRGVEILAPGASPGATSPPIAHGLPGTPSAIVATPNVSLGAANVRVDAKVGSVTATDFTITVRSNNDANIGGNVTVYWLAIL